jgi:hypothetical protein
MKIASAPSAARSKSSIRDVSAPGALDGVGASLDTRRTV